MLRKAALAAGCLLLLLPTTSALGEFPYPAPGPYDELRLGAGVAPDDLTGKRVWMYAATPEEENAVVNADPRELNGVRGAHVVDEKDTVETAWMHTTGRPDVTIAVLDSGIMWDDHGTMRDIREKTRISRGEAPPPNAARSTPLEPGVDCGAYAAALAAGGTGGDAYDLDGNGVFNLLDYACDARVDRDPARGVGPKPGGVALLDPQDVLIAFTDGEDDDANGYADDIVGWDFLDDDNDPFDDVSYGHGSGEAKDSGAEADNNGEGGGELGTCPNCLLVHMRVGDSFIADVNDFAQATIYAVDNDVEVVQEALGTLNNSVLGRQAVEYAYNHGVTVIASAADEAAQHNNWPSSNPHVILVNSVTKYPGQNLDPQDFGFPDSEPIPDAIPVPGPNQPGRSYLEFNGCTNFNSKITLAIPSVSCSSDATGRAAGMAGLIYSAAYNALDAGDLAPHPTCERIDGEACVLSANEVRQAMASGTLDGILQADDVSFTTGAEPRCTPATVRCTSPFIGAGLQTDTRAPFPPRSYPARRGHDQFYGYGRVNMRKAVEHTQAGVVFPEAEIEAPDWYWFIDPEQPSFDVRGHVGARGATYRCRVLVAPGSYPNNAEEPAGDFVAVDAGHCDGSDRTAAHRGLLATIDVDALKARFPPDSQTFSQRETGLSATHTSNGRPNDDPYGFIVKVVVEAGEGDDLRTGQDHRNFRLHRDQDMIDGFPADIGGDGASSPAFADLDGDNQNELIIAGSDGIVHAYRRDLTEAPGWPARVDRVPVHSGAPAFASGEVTDDARGAILGSVAVGDLDRDGLPEVVVNDLEGKVTAFRADGSRAFTQESDIRFSGKPLQPFENVRRGPLNRTQHGFIGSPVLADLDGDDGGRLEVVAAAMDRHVYAWNDDGTPVTGYPALVVDYSKVDAVDPVTHAVRFDQDRLGYEDNDPTKAPIRLNQGAIVNTPAVGDLDGDERPEIVVGTNEEYAASAPHEGGHNVAPFNGFVLKFVVGTTLAPANTRLHALTPAGDPDGDPRTATPQLENWPVKLAQSGQETLPIVGEGVTGSPIIGDVDCPEGPAGPRVGAQAHAGPPFILNRDGTSCYGTAPDEQGDERPVPLQSDGKTGAEQTDTPVINAFGHPIFANVDGGPSTSYFTPALGALRALDIAFPEYQGGQDFLAGWTGETGQFRPNWPARMNDLQFLTGPSVGEVDGATPSQEILSGSASLDLQGFNAGGAPLDPKWPKLTSDWMVANPLIGGWGDDDKKVVVSATRSGFLLAYSVGAGVCAGPDQWPRFHHDNYNSGDARRTADDRDAVQPGTPQDVRVEDGEVRYTAAGDDLMCGDAEHEVRTSDQPITGESFEDAEPVGGEAAARRAPGDEEAVGGTLKRYVAVRAVDDAGNVGRVVAIDTAPPPPPDDGGGSGDGDGDGGGGPFGGGAPGGPPAGPPRPGSRPGGGQSAGGCVPNRLLRSATLAARGRALRFTIPAAAGGVAVDVFQQSVGRRLGDRLVARFPAHFGSFRWNGRSNIAGRRVRDGILFVRMRAGGETKRFALRRRRGRFALRPGYYRPAHCKVLASAKLLRPVFGGRRNRGLSLSFRLTRVARVAVTVTRGRRVVRRFAAREYPAGRTFRLGLRSARRGDHRVRIVATAGSTVDRVTLVARRL